MKNREKIDKNILYIKKQGNQTKNDILREEFQKQ